MRGDGGGKPDAVLASAVSAMMRGFAHFHGEQALADSVVDFVRASMEEISRLR